MTENNENYTQLRAKILLECTHLTNIEVGQVFNSKYYGNIVATIIDKRRDGYYTICGFDTNEGLSRSCTYIVKTNGRYSSDLDIVGKEPTLSDVLFWFKLKKYKYAHFEEDNFCIYDSDEGYAIKWDLTKCYLKDQSEELIEFLNEI